MADSASAAEHGERGERDRRRNQQVHDAIPTHGRLLLVPASRAGLPVQSGEAAGSDRFRDTLRG
jgi:hypothetical protein